MTHRISKLLLLLFISLFPFITYAWNALGHRVIANIAYQQLTGPAREEVDHSVAYLQQEYADITSFLQMADWPDTIRSLKIDTFNRWHYMDVAFSNDGTPLKNLLDTDNAVWAVNNLATVVRYQSVNPYERARFLAFLTHIVGDLHQPLHTVSLISSAHPDGDQGGNLYFVLYHMEDSERISLHKLWDNGMGVLDLDPSPDNVALLTEKITSLYPKSYFGSQIDDLDPDDWAKEGLQLAKTFAYGTAENQTPAPKYIEEGKQTAEQKVALAGYRLGNLLNQLLG